jgi:vancomycin resistance protein YoaR
MSFVIVPKPQRSPLPAQILFFLVGGLVIFLLASGLLAGGYQLFYAGQILPGVSIMGVDLSGVSLQQAPVVLSQHLIYPAAGRIVFRAGNQIWIATPEELGMVFDWTDSVQEAYAAGRKGGPVGSLTTDLQARIAGVDLPPVVLIDQRVAYGYLQKLATQIDQPVVESDLHLNGTQVIYTPGQSGRYLDVDATLNLLMHQLQSFQDGEVSLQIKPLDPLVKDASQPAAILRQMLNAPLTLTIPNPQAGDPAPWSIDAAHLADLLTIQPVQNRTTWQYQIGIDTQGLQPLMDQIATQVNRSPQNARFFFDDTTRQLVLLQSAVEGRIVDEAGTEQAIQAGLLAGNHAIPLKVVVAQPQVGNNATAASLGITGLVSERKSYFRGSIPDRIQNIVTAAARFHGLLVPPNSVFSMADALGDVSLDNGYEEAPIIYNGRTIMGVGGGVCQVSTTLFQTAFYGGYPIVERHPHAYRVLYYEQNATGDDPNLVGLDATVYVPLVDLKFQNDRPSWLLMEVYVDPANFVIDWKFYSGEDGRKVVVNAPIIKNVIPAPTQWDFEENQQFQPGEVALFSHPVAGEDVTVDRTVYRQDGSMILSDSIQTQYQPWQGVCQYGPGTQDPQAIAKQANICQP